MKKIPKIVRHKNAIQVLFVVLVIATLFRPLQLVVSNSDKFFSRTYHEKFNSYKDAYYSSQYVKKVNPGIMPDEIFESFAGGAFLQGMNPILIVHDHPPLGRYFVSLSILLFDNQHTIMLPLLFFALLAMFLIAQKTIDNMFVALVPVAIFANEPIFLNKILYTPLPEPMNLPFILFTTYFFLKSIDAKKFLHWYLLSSIMLGFVISIRFFVLGAVLSFSQLFYLITFVREKKRILYYVFSLPIAGVILLASYTRTMLDGYSPLKIVGVQRYILEYHQSKFILPFTYWDLLLFNRWHTWWGERNIIPDTNWFILWPFTVVVSFIGAIGGLVRKFNLTNYEVVLLLWVTLYSIALSTGYTSTRYFLPIIPYFYIIATSLLFRLMKYLMKSYRVK